MHTKLMQKKATAKTTTQYMRKHLNAAVKRYNKIKPTLSCSLAQLTVTVTSIPKYHRSENAERSSMLFCNYKNETHSYLTAWLY